MKESRTKRLGKSLAAALMAMVMAGALALTGCSGDKPGGGEASTGQVTITVDITAAVEDDDPTAIALALEYGANTRTFEVKIGEGATVLSSLKDSEFVVATKSSGSMGEYVDAIDGLASGAVSAESGWTYTVNGEMVLEGADSLQVHDGDVIVWTYVTSWE